MALFDRKDPMQEMNTKLDGLMKTVEGLTQGLTQMSTAVQTLHTNQTQMNQDFGAMKQEFSGNASQFQHVATNDRYQEQQQQAIRGLHEYGPEELEQMTEADKWRIQAEYSDARMLENIKKAVDPIGEQFGNFQAQTAQEKAKAQLERIMNEQGPDGKALRPDFKDMLQTMVELKKDPARANLGFDELYDLSHSHVKRTQPEKYAALQDKHFPKPENVRQPYGGFLSDQSQKTETPGDMSIPDAAQEAAREVLEDSGSFFGADGMGEMPA